MAKILIWDIETSPNVGYFWQSGYKLNIGPENIIHERQVICIAYKWLDKKEVHLINWDPKKHKDKDKKMLKEFSKVYAEADMSVAHNGDNFDVKWIKGRLLYHSLPPLSDCNQCDTLKIARASFRLNSNKLDYIAKYIGIEGKTPMNFGDWKGVMAGKKASLDKMGKYCKQDVLVLEEVYKKLQPYAKGAGIAQGYNQDKNICPSCGEDETRKHGFYYTRSGKFQKYRCMSCFHNWRCSQQVKKNG